MAGNDRLGNYYDIVEAAAELKIHPQSVRRLIKKGDLAATLFAGKYIIEEDEMRSFSQNYDPKPGRKRKPKLF